VSDKRPFLIGLTGSIGMGKSTTAKLFENEGVPIWDADAAVHRLYMPGGLAVLPMAQAFPESLVDGGISRAVLKEIIADNPDALHRIEQIVHPLVAKDRAAFVAAADTDIVVLDIPLLFETGAAESFDLVVVVSAPAEVQRRRVLDRPGMSAADFERILSRQVPDAEKRAKADVVITTDTLESAREQVRSLLGRIRGEKTDA